MVGNILKKNYNWTNQQNEIEFYLGGKANRIQPNIKNIASILSLKTTSYPQRQHEYIIEYVYLDILRKFFEEHEELIRKEALEKQRVNFIISYISYVMQHLKETAIPKEIGKEYTRYTTTSEHSELISKLDMIDAVKNDSVNPNLREHVKHLFVLSHLNKKMHFIFSIEGSPDNEEMRETLDVMQDSKSSNDYASFYRGQASSFWELDSSLTREKNFLTKEKDLYYEILSLKPDEFSNDDSVYERLITMQHYGMPTRLMDLTRNPLVAMFFACNNKELSYQDGAIYMFTPKADELLNFEDEHLKCLRSYYAGESDFENDDLINQVRYIRGIAKNQRISNQSGDFLFVGNVENKITEIEEKLERIIVIDAKAKKVLLELLEKLNMHGGSVYPDLTHMSNYIKDKYMNH